MTSADQEQAGSGEDRLAAIVREMGNTEDGIKHCLGHDNNTWLISELARAREQGEIHLTTFREAASAAHKHKAEIKRLKADLERVTGERDYWQEAFDGMRMDVQHAQAQRDAALAVVKAARGLKTAVWRRARSLLSVAASEDVEIAHSRVIDALAALDATRKPEEQNHEFSQAVKALDAADAAEGGQG